ncbi:NmrA family NAD(P)-binding protein [Streptomyces sp. B21-083]|uniref:NmrA family NAD(P)-binding protein n=1 Tax=Streptomyces sp. B21-083 TaxID=3039410 RepID=UPI002FEE834C
MILVLGASGDTGLAVTRALAARGAEVRAFIRDTGKAKKVLGAGATEVAEGDLRDLAAIERAATGCEGVYFIGPRFMPEEAQLGKAVVDIAERTGIRRFVFSGVYHPSISALLNHQPKLAVEDHLYKTDLEFTVLQPSRFMHGPLVSGWARAVQEGVYADAFSPDARMAYVDYEDVAEAVAIAFTEQRLVRGTFELSAPGEYTARDIAAHLAEALGRPVRAEQAALDQYGPAAQQGLLASPFAAEGFKRLREYYDGYGFRGGNGLVLETILGREPTGIAAWIARHLRTRQST